MSLNANVGAQLRALALEGADESARLNDSLRLLSKWRSVLIQRALLARQGTVVGAGPMKGLDFLSRSAEGCHVPKLLGTYEQPLHPHLEEAMAAEYDVVLNIGCAEGYYAVGLARRMPRSRVHAFDLDPQARTECAALAVKNGVADRVVVGALFSPEDFADHAGGRVLVLCDIEGGERALLDPAAAPALAGMDLIVEAHDCFDPGIADALTARFEPTHEIVRIEDDGRRAVPDAPRWFEQLSHLDQLLAVWEWRTGPTPWLIMKARRGRASP